MTTESEKYKNAAEVFKRSAEFYRQQEKIAREQLNELRADAVYHTAYISYLQDHIKILESIDSKLDKLISIEKERDYKTNNRMWSQG